MALELSVGVILGFCILVFVTVAFALGLLIYFIYDKCRGASSNKYKDLEGDRIGKKTEPDGSSWTNPVIEMEEVNEETENNNYDSKDGETPSKPHSYVEVIEEPVVEEEQGATHLYDNQDFTEPEPYPMPVPEEVEQVPDDIAEEVEEEVEEEEVVEEPEEVRPVTPVMEVAAEEFQETPGYARVGDVVRNDPEEEDPPKARVGKLTNRISAFEEKYKESSLVRGSRRQELEGIQSKVVSNLVTEYETSDSVLSGRQMSDDPAFLLAVGNSSNSASNSLQRNPSFNNQGANNNNNYQNASNVVPPIPEAPNRQSYLDEDTGEPLYSQPDLTKKSIRRSKRDSSKTVSFVDDASSIDGNLASPGVPPKAPDL